LKEEKSKKKRIIIAKPGLDGHDRGAVLVAKALRDAGFEVIYLGRHQSVNDIVQAAAQENADAVGLSILSGIHTRVSSDLVKQLEEEGIRRDIKVIVGGLIPDEDVPVLKDLGIDAVFPSGTPMNDIISYVSHDC